MGKIFALMSQNLRIPQYLWRDLSFMDSEFVPTVGLEANDSLIRGFPDSLLAALSPVITYWIFSGMYHILDVYNLFEQYKIHPGVDVESRNRASRINVLIHVLLQHFLQILLSFLFLFFDKNPVVVNRNVDLWKWKQSVPSWIPNFVIYIAYQYGVSTLKFFISIFLIDTWQFWLHYLLHTNKTLYRKFHAHHHRISNPFAYSALYNNPVEGFIVDSLGSGLVALLMRLTYVEQSILYSFSSIKTVDDHSGYAIPWNPLQFLFPNNSLYHDIHHQNFGIKTNFSQPFFTIWDTICNTKFEKFEEYQLKQKEIREERYKQLLNDKDAARKAKVKTHIQKAE